MKKTFNFLLLFVVTVTLVTLPTTQLRAGAFNDCVDKAISNFQTRNLGCAGGAAAIVAAGAVACAIFLSLPPPFGVQSYTACVAQYARAAIVSYFACMDVSAALLILDVIKCRKEP